MEDNISNKFDTNKGLLEPQLPKIYDNYDVALAAIMLIIGLLYCNWIIFSDLGLGVTLFAALFCTIAGVYMNVRGYRQTPKSLTYLAIVTISALQFCLFDNKFLKLFNLLFLSVTTVYWISVTTNKRVFANLSAYSIWDILNQFLKVPFSNFSCAFSILSSGIFKNKKSRNLLTAILGLILFAPVLIIVTSLLIDADAAFSEFMQIIANSISENLTVYFLQFLMGIPVCCYLYGIIYGNARGRNVNKITVDSVEKTLTNIRFAPKIAVYSAITALCFIYIIFFATQAVYLFSAFKNVLPETMTYSEYARRGFFELCKVSAINLGVLAVAYCITKREENEPKAFRIYAIILITLTMLLLLTAMSKMWLYVRSYGLTFLRVYTSWFMIMLLFILVILLIGRFKKFNGGRAIIITCIAFFSVLCYANVDKVIAKHNIDRHIYNQESEDNFVSEMMQLSDGAGLYFCDLYETTDDPKLKQLLYNIISKDYMRANDDKNFREFNLQSSQYHKRIKNIVNSFSA